MDSAGLLKPPTKAVGSRQAVLDMLVKPDRPVRGGPMTVQAPQQPAIRLGGGRPGGTDEDHAPTVRGHASHLADYSRPVRGYDVLEGVNGNRGGDAAIRDRETGTVAREAPDVLDPRLVAMTLVWTRVNGQDGPICPPTDSDRARAYFTN